MSKKNSVVYEIDLQSPPVLSEGQQAEINELIALPDDSIDTSDIPVLSEAFWSNAISNPHYRPIKSQITLRLDSDVLTWLRASGRGYQTKLNRILRDAMTRDAPNSTTIPGPNVPGRHKRSV
jgi:uncharacterized protein (DUF4415 family)